MPATNEEATDTYPTEMALDSWLNARHPKLRKLAPKLPPAPDEASNTPLSYVGSANLQARVVRILRDLVASNPGETELEMVANQIVHESQQAYLFDS